MSRDQHVVIVGGGILGLASAWYCRQRGMRVTVVDRGDRARSGCSYGNAGLIVPSHFVPLAAPGMIALGLKWMWNPESPFYIRPRLSPELIGWLWRFRRACSRRHVTRAAPLLRDLHLQSQACYRQLEESLPGGIGLRESGLLMLCRTQATLDEESETAEMAEGLQIPVRVLNALETAEVEPGIEMDVRGSVFFPGDCRLSPRTLMDSLQQALTDDDCQFLWHTDSTGFVTEGNRVRAVETTAGEIPADEVVLCGGVWTSGLAKSLGVSLPMQAGKGYSLTLEHPVQRPQICSILTEARVAVTPIGESLRFAGTMELAGMDESISRSRVRGIVRAIPHYFPRFSQQDFEQVEPWAGLRPCSPDGLPYLGRTERWSNVVFATGHAMLGISLALVSGKIVAELIDDGRSPSVPSLELMSPDRFAGGRRGSRPVGV